MSDERDDAMDALAAALREPPRPGVAARTAALAAARAAHAREWDGEKVSGGSQGSGEGLRPRVERSDGRTARRSDDMTAIPFDTPSQALAELPPPRRVRGDARRGTRPSRRDGHRAFWMGTASAAAVALAAFVALDAGGLRGLVGPNEAEVETAARDAGDSEDPQARGATEPAASTPSPAPSVETPAPLALREIAPETLSDALAPAAKQTMRADRPLSAERSVPAERFTPAERFAPTGGRVPTVFARDPSASIYAPQASTERYPEIEVSGTLTVADAPVSTFSIDVDTASYALARASLSAGEMPHPDAVRPEEMLNYFDYDLPAPTGGEPFAVAASVVDTPWNSGTRIVQLAINADAPVVAERAPRNLVFLVDTSGSMDAPDKLPLLKKSFRLLLTQLDPRDEVAIVAYAGTAGTALEPTPASDAATILAALDGLGAGGLTAGGAGLQAAYDLAERMTGEGENARIVLATDGDFNVGPSDDDALTRLVASKREVAPVVVLGFGRGNLNDRLMQAIAQNGDGFAAYVDTEAEARRVLVDRVAGTLETVAKDVKIQVEFNPALVSEYRLIGYETRALERAEFNDDRVDAGEVGAGHQVVALYEITPIGSEAELVDPLRYGTSASSDTAEAASPSADELMWLRLRYKAPEGGPSRLIERAVAPDAAEIDGGETRFALAVAAFAEMLRGAPELSGFTLDGVEALARDAMGRDTVGRDADRREFLALVGLAKLAR